MFYLSLFYFVKYHNNFIISITKSDVNKLSKSYELIYNFFI